MNLAILTYLGQNINYIWSALGVLVFAAINTIPEKRPQTKDEYYAWFKEALQTALPMRAGGRNATK